MIYIAITISTISHLGGPHAWCISSRNADARLVASLPNSNGWRSKLELFFIFQLLSGRCLRPVILLSASARGLKLVLWNFWFPFLVLTFRGDCSSISLNNFAFYWVILGRLCSYPYVLHLLILTVLWLNTTTKWLLLQKS